MVGLPFLSKIKKTQNKFLTVNINSHDVKCIAFYQDENAKLKIIGSGKQFLESGSVRSGNIADIKNVTEALEIASSQACENSELIKNAIIGVTGDLCMGLTTTVRLKKGGQVKFKKDDVDSLVKKVNETSYIETMNEYVQSTGNTDVDLEIITSSNVYTRIDNEFVDNPVDKKGTILEMSVFNAYTPYYHIENLNKVFKGAGLNILAIGSELYALAGDLKMSNEGLEDFIIIDLSEDSTNVGIVFGGGIVATKSMQIGYKHFVESISDKMGLTIAEASKILKAYIGESLTQSEGLIVQGCVEEVVEVWIEGIQILFKEFSGVKTFASKIFLTGAGIIIKDLNIAITTEPWVKSIPFKEPPEYKSATFMDLNNITDSSGATTGNEWVNIASLGSIYTEMMGEIK